MTNKQPSNGPIPQAIVVLDDYFGSGVESILGDIDIWIVSSKTNLEAIDAVARTDRTDTRLDSHIALISIFDDKMPLCALIETVVDHCTDDPNTAEGTVLLEIIAKSDLVAIQDVRSQIILCGVDVILATGPRVFCRVSVV